MEGPEWDALTHSTVQMGSGEEVMVIISRGGEGGHRQGFQLLWDPPGDGDLLQIPGTGDLGGRRRLDGGGKELVPGAGGMEEDDANFWQGGGGAAGVRLIFQSYGAGSADIWIGDLGGHPPHGKRPGGVSGPGGETADRADPTEETGQEVDVHLGGARTWLHIILLRDHC